MMWQGGAIHLEKTFIKRLSSLSLFLLLSSKQNAIVQLNTFNKLVARARVLRKTSYHIIVCLLYKYMEKNSVYMYIILLLRLSYIII